MPEHVSITDPEIHEPKGVAAANSGEVYIADGAASGDWTKVKEQLQGRIDDISTAQVVYVPTLSAGRISRINVVLQSAITIADATITVKDSLGTTVATLVVPYTGSAAGDIVSATIGTSNSVSALDSITVETDGGSTDVAKLLFIVEVEIS